MTMYEYTYITWTLFFALIWIGLYFSRKDTRKEMLWISILMGFAGILTESTHVLDWWQPITLTGTSVGFEDFLIGFFIGGIASVIYEFIAHKKLSSSQRVKKDPFFGKYFFRVFFLVVGFIFLGSFFLLSLHSFYALSLSLLCGIGYIWYRRHDLIKNSLISGVLVGILGSLSYPLLEWIYPGWVNAFWNSENVWFSYVLFNVPIAEYIWWFLAGTFIGPLYEYWNEKRLINA